jgi:hypothetical protein
VKQVLLFLLLLSSQYNVSAQRKGTLAYAGKEMLAFLTENGEVKRADRLLDIEDTYQRSSFTAVNPDLKYTIVLIYLKEDPKPEGYFTFGEGKRHIPFKEMTETDTYGCLVLAVELDLGRTGEMYFKHNARGRRTLTHLYVVEYPAH